MENTSILWVDDEIDLLKVQILFLERRGYTVETVNNGYDAIDLIKTKSFDIIFLDENMPGISGLETLEQIKDVTPHTPIVMITKSEEEDLMNDAIGSKIADYLIKPVNPNQILLSIKKNIQKNQLISQKTTSQYQQQFSKLAMLISDARTFEEWVEVYKKLVFWELELERSNDTAMDEVLAMQKSDANNGFVKFIQHNYVDWFQDKGEKPLLSPNVFKTKVEPLLKAGKKVALLVVDNLRFDQWRIMQPILSEFMNVESEDIYCSILPTATQYARNALFAGLMPLDITRLLPDLWVEDDEEGTKNQFEEQLLEKQLQRLGLKVRMGFRKVMNNREGRRLVDNIHEMEEQDLSVIVYNFIDILSHARTEMQMIRELANDESAYRSLTSSWFVHSPLLDMLRQLAKRGFHVVITTDHGTIRVHNPIKVIGDRSTNTNLRFKQGKNLDYKSKEVYEIRRPEQVRLPSNNLSSTYIFARNEDFFAYPNNYAYYVKYYKNTFQHGGISLEEMLIPLVVLTGK